jgi:hypothetical protein
LLLPFSTADLDQVIFCTNIPRTSHRTDNANFTTTFDKEAKRIEEHASVWKELQNLKLENNPDDSAKNVPCSVVPYNDDALKRVQELGKNYDQVISCFH